jgi:transcriptional regulator with XRE-family HTH domain
MDALHKRVVVKIRQLSREKKMPISHLPDHAGVSRSHFWEVIGGRKSPTLQWLERVADALSVDVEELFRRA